MSVPIVKNLLQNFRLYKSTNESIQVLCMIFIYNLLSNLM